MGTDGLIPLNDGAAEYMGDGVFAIFQKDEYGVAHNVVLSESDLRKMLAES